MAFSVLQESIIGLSESFLKQKLDFLDVRDAGKVLRDIIQLDFALWPNVLNIGTGQFVDGAELVTIINEYSINNKRKPLNYSIRSDNKAARDFGMDVERLRSIFSGYNPRSLRETVVDVYRFLNYNYLSTHPTKDMN